MPRVPRSRKERIIAQRANDPKRLAREHAQRETDRQARALDRAELGNGTKGNDHE